MPRTRPYRNTLLTPEAIDTLALEDPEGLLAEALQRKGSTITKATAAIAKHNATQVIATSNGHADADDEPTSPKPTKYGRTGSGKPVSEVAWTLRQAERAVGRSMTYQDAVAFVLEHADQL